MSIGNIEWPHLLADITAKRDALNQVIETLTTHFIKDEAAGVAPSPQGSRGRRLGRKPGPKPGRRTRALKRDGRTDGRTDGARTAPAQRSAEPP